MLEKQHIQYFKNLVGGEDFFTDLAHLNAYCYDATKERHLPSGVIFPKNEQEISQILKYCNEHRIIVVPRGLGAVLQGGVERERGLVLSVEKHLDKILEIDTKNLIARVEPGVINKHFQNEVEKLDLFYPQIQRARIKALWGMSLKTPVACGAAKYGITKDYVMAMRVVLANGEIIRAGKKTIKDVAGFNVVGLMIASEGCLGVISEITLKLLAKPPLKQSAMGVFNHIEDAMNAVYKTMSSGVTPVAMEFLDNLSIKAVEERFSKGLPKDAGAILITQVDGVVKEQIAWQLNEIEKHFKANGCVGFKIAQNEQEEQDLWFSRRNASQSISVYGKKKLNEDVTVPRASLPSLLQEVAKISQKYGFKIPCFGHTGDGNVHVNIMLEDPNRDLEKGHQAMEEIFQAAISLEGTLSGEHGIGLSKAKFMPLAFNHNEMELFRNIKKALDPNNILNPFKMGL